MDKCMATALALSKPRVDLPLVHLCPASLLPLQGKGLIRQLPAAPKPHRSLRVRSVLQPASRPQGFPVHPSTDASPLAHPFEQDAAPSNSKRGDAWRVVPEIWGTLATRHPDAVALLDPHRPGQPSLTFQELNDSILSFGEGLKSLGLGKGECVALLSENSHRWLVADQGVMSVGACDAVRGTKSSARELQYIVLHSDSVGVVVEDEAVLGKLLPLLKDDDRCPPLKFVVLLWPSSADTASLGLGCPVVSYDDVINAGRTRIQQGRDAPGVERSLREDDIASLVFTSGTTGQPKAVMLTHANLMHQVEAFVSILKCDRGDVYLSLLPPWHMYERSCEYFSLSQGVQLVYSGVKTFKEDLTKYPRDIFVAVPLVFDILYNGVQKKLAAASAARAAVAGWLITASLAFMESLRAWQGRKLPKLGPTSTGGRKEEDVKVDALVEVVVGGALALLLLPFHFLASKLVYSKVKAAIPIRKVAITGGGSLAPHVDKFFAALGVTLLNGYGLTETSPVLAVRRSENNLLGTVGLPIDRTQIKVVDPGTGATLPDGAKGIVKGKGPQVMKGYYKNPAATAAVIDAEGWFDTGDIGWITPDVPYGPSRNCGRQLVLEGRAKDTIVLANGENVEPAFVEEVILRSPAINQIMVFGQDQRRLSALVVPNVEEVERMVLESRRQQEGGGAEGEPTTEEERRRVIRQEIVRCSEAGGCGPNERIGTFAILEHPFSIENSLLTATMKMKRDAILLQYKDVCGRLLQGHDHHS